MADFTALHQALGAERGPITNEMLDDAISQGIEEGDQLDWKGQHDAQLCPQIVA